MRVLLLQLDGKIPNIALMRLSAHLKERGHTVELRKAGNEASIEPRLDDDFEQVYASLIFERTRPVAERLLKIRPEAVVGGTGWDFQTTLESIGVTTNEQDYTAYPDYPFSLGFCSRGCRFNEKTCPWCVVPKKEGRIVEVQTINEIWRGEGHPKRVVLLDNDFFGQPHWRERIAELSDFEVSFNQGVVVRKMNREIAAAIASVKYRDDQFKRPTLYTAWDNQEDEEKFFAGLKMLCDAGVKPNHVMVYMLIGFGTATTPETWDHRRKRLREWGCKPYPMPFVRTDETTGFQRWVIGGYDNGDDPITWAEWKAAKYQPRNLRRYERNLRLPVIG